MPPTSRLGLTTEFSAITVCLLGGAVMFGFAELAVALAILTSAVLTFKQPLHGLVGKFDSSDLYAGLKLLLATFIVLPLLPNRTYYDPWLALNPFKLWLLVILISALSLLALCGGAFARTGPWHCCGRTDRWSGVFYGSEF